MSSNGDSAFGDATASAWLHSLRPDRTQLSPSRSVAPSALETASISASQIDRLPFGSSLPSQGKAQSSALPSGAWNDRKTRPFPLIDSAGELVQNQVRRLMADPVTPLRLASHLSVLGVAALILILSQINIPNWDFSPRLLPSSAMLTSNNIGGGFGGAGILTGSSSSVLVSNSESLQRAAIPFTIVSEEPQKEVQYYTVQPGDTVLGIAQKHGLRPETIQWSNAGLEVNADMIRPGDQLRILPINGAIHVVAPGDTLSSLASKYKVAMEDIVNYPANGLEDVSAPLTVGRELVIPGGTKPFVQQQVFAYSGVIPSTAKLGSGSFDWPASGSISQGYWGGHPAIDIAGWTGAPVKAADSGYVALATGGWSGGYGNHVIVDHGNGFVTLYAHLNSIYVSAGESVTRGQQIGSLGNTGNSTGPHLHLEIRYQGVPRNPLSYLP